MIEQCGGVEAIFDMYRERERERERERDVYTEGVREGERNVFS